MILLPENIALRIDQVVVEKTLTITLRSTVHTAACPSCGHSAKRIHSRYQRSPSDLPVSGRPVRLIIEVRRFFCTNASCSRHTFAEPLPTLIHAHAQRTQRLQESLQQLGLVLGGEAGARLGQQMGMPVSPDSLLRLIRQAKPPERTPARIIGLDDWAYKRRLRYGTLICDLETGRTLDVLPDRAVQTVYAWLQDHPEVEIISRDRWSEYATAALKGAPHATQVADRWHLLNNLVESLTALLARCRTEIRQAVVADTPKQAAEPSQSPPPARTPAQAHRQDQYEQVQRLFEQGLRAVQIAARVGIGERTVYRWLAGQQAPDWHHRSPGESVLDPYKTYVLKRWQEGCRKGVTLLHELQAQGYHGSARAIYRYLDLLNASPETSTPVEFRLLERFSAKRAVWLLIKEAEDLDRMQQQELSFMRHASAQVDQAYRLAQAFTHMLRQRQGQHLADWLHAVTNSPLPELRQFAAGIERDKAAVQAGLTLSYSNGLVEGQVNRLKLIKRSMYGRAKFDLLRQRVLCAP